VLTEKSGFKVKGSSQLFITDLSSKKILTVIVTIINEFSSNTTKTYDPPKLWCFWRRVFT